MDKIELFGVIVGGALIALCVAGFIFLMLGCTTPEVNKCTFICPTNNVPADCYCLEDEINREAGKLNYDRR